MFSFAPLRSRLLALTQVLCPGMSALYETKLGFDPFAFPVWLAESWMLRDWHLALALTSPCGIATMDLIW